MEWLEFFLLGQDHYLTTHPPLEEINPFSPGDDLSRLLQIKYTLIRQLLGSCLIMVYFICKRRLKSSPGLNELKQVSLYISKIFLR